MRGFATGSGVTEGMEILKKVADLALDFRKRAEEVDRGERPPALHLEQMAEIGYFKFVADADPGPRRRALDLFSSGCGVTSFLATQHEGVCRRLHKAEHPLLDDAVAGRRWCGVCFAHLRRDTSPVDAIVFRDHVVFSGSGPWFTGHGVMDRVMVGGATSEGELLMGLSPVDLPEIVVKPIPRLAVMEATATVGLDFNALHVALDDIIVRLSREELNERDMHSTVFQAARSLGAARAAAEFLPDSAKAEVECHLASQHDAMDDWDQNPGWETAIMLRQKALTLAADVIAAAFVNVGGKVHLLHHPLQRLAREASFYSTTQLTAQLREAVTRKLSTLSAK